MNLDLSPNNLKSWNLGCANDCNEPAFLSTGVHRKSSNRKSFCAGLNADSPSFLRILRRSALYLCCFSASACSPLKTSPHDEKHQWEIKLHQVQTELDDLRHDTNCFQTELQILDGRIKYYENALASLKQHDLEKQRDKLDALAQDLSSLEKKWNAFELSQEGAQNRWRQTASHANETTLALSQFKSRIQELEQEILSQNRRFEELAKIKGSIETLVKSFKTPYKIYRVCPGDTLEKIANAHHTKVEKIKKLNDLAKDLIVVDQELKIPIEP